MFIKKIFLIVLIQTALDEYQTKKYLTIDEARNPYEFNFKITNEKNRKDLKENNREDLFF